MKLTKTRLEEITTPLALTQIQNIKKLESNEGAFFAHTADNVDWIVEGTHPLAGHYHSKAEFLAHTFEKLPKVLPQGTQLHVEPSASIVQLPS